jgi:hypothetical protein
MFYNANAHQRKADRRTWLRAGALVCLAAFTFGTASTASAARTIRSLPHEEHFDTNAYASDIVWTVQGGTHAYMASSGWRGGAAKFTPPTTGEGMSGLGQFMFSGLSSIPEQINVRFLVYHGSTWNQYAPGNKLVIMNRDGNRGRPMIISRHVGSGAERWETWGACDGTICRYEGGDYWPDGTDTLRIGNPSVAREHEWISVEFEANTRTGMIRLYVDSQDGRLSGLYVERPMDDSGTGGAWSYIDTVGGYMSQAIRSDPENYYMIDELKIASSKIGPPSGFVGGSVRPNAPSSLQVQ